MTVVAQSTFGTLSESLAGGDNNLNNERSVSLDCLFSGSVHDICAIVLQVFWPRIRSTFQ